MWLRRIPALALLIGELQQAVVDQKLQAGLAVEIVDELARAAELGQQTFDFILSFSVLYHLSNEILANYFQAVRRRLKPSAHHNRLQPPGNPPGSSCL